MTEPRPIIRPATADDARAYVDYMNAIGGESDFLSFGENGYGRDVDAARAMLGRIARHENEAGFVAVASDCTAPECTAPECTAPDCTLAGTILLEASQRPHLRHAAELSITVRKSFWGRRLGSALLEHALAWARSAGTLRKINLEVRVDNHAAVKLYERHGFQVEGRRARSMCVRGTFHPALLMGLTIDPPEDHHD